MPTRVHIHFGRVATLLALSLTLACVHEPVPELELDVSENASEPASESPRKRRADPKHSLMLHLARSWGAEAARSADPQIHQRAKQSYERYLANYPFGPNGYAVQYAYSELLWTIAVTAARSQDVGERQRADDYFGEAHEHFVHTLELNPEGEFTVAAAWWQVEAMRNHLRYREPPAVTRACQVNLQGGCTTRANYLPIEYSADARRMLDAYDIYAKYVHGEESRGILLARAQLLIQHNRFDDAELALVQIIDRLPTSRPASGFGEVDHQTVTMLLDVLTVQWLRAGDDPQRVFATSDALEAWLSKLEAMEIWHEPKLEHTRAELWGLLRAVAWRRALAHRAAGDDEGFSKCAAQFVELHDQFPEHAEASTMLWNAAECLAAAAHGGEAVRMLEALLVRYPDSEHAPAAMLRLAELHQALARPEDSAKYYETFAEGFQKHERAVDALENAYLLRVGLGHAEQAQADLRRFERLYRRKHVDRAAALVWSQHDQLDTNTAKRSHALEYLKSYGSEGGVDRAMVAEAVIAQIDWHRSCDEPLLHDACVAVVRYRYGGATPLKRCRLETGTLVHVYSRDAKLRAAAQARFDRVLALARKAEPPTDDPRRLAAFREAWGMAMVYKTDQDYERYLLVEPPEDLDFYADERLRNSGVASLEYEYWQQGKKRETSMARLLKFIGAKTQLAEDLQAQYAKVSETGSPAWIIAAAARTAAIEQLFADQLFRAEIPQTLTSPEHERAYCEALAARARPIRARALAAYTICVARSTEYEYANEFSRMCEDELEKWDEHYSGYVLGDELLGDELVTTSRIEQVGVRAEPD